MITSGRQMRWLAAGLLAVGSIAADSDRALLLRALFRYRIAAQAAADARQLAASAPSDVAREVATGAEAWSGAVYDSIRSELENALGDRAKSEFGGFATAYIAAEERGDATWLATLAQQLRVSPIPRDYAALRRAMVEECLSAEVAEAASFVGEVQTWLELRQRSEDVPPLRSWLSRTEPVAVQPASDAPPRLVRQTARSDNPLREAEAPAGAFVASEEPAAAGLEALSGARAARREKALEVAQAGMQQVAEERRAAEEELAAKKTAAAQAEAEALKKQAEKLAASEQEALEQRKNSWSGRLKQVVSSAIGAAGGAFLGGIGTRAGEAAAEAVFR
ncbi:MAG: hypothetical protein N2652_07685 [Kiritimatiellae bacterium]|nr:hypothetical protein [Kiritimatiellia bacterium]